MARRLISLDELDTLEGLVEHHRQLQERLETLEAAAAEFDASANDTLELSRKANALRSELITLLEYLHTRIEN